MNLKEMDWQLELIVASQSLSREARMAAKYASELLCAFRTIENTDWTAEASSLYSRAIGLANEMENLKRLGYQRSE